MMVEKCIWSIKKSYQLKQIQRFGAQEIHSDTMDRPNQLYKSCIKINAERKINENYNKKVK